MLRTSIIFVLAALAVLFTALQVEAQESPIMMNRREAAPFGDILTELKGKGLGGRMRFGKRSMSPYRFVYDQPLEAQRELF